MTALKRTILLRHEVKAILRMKSDSAFQEMINAGKFPRGFLVGLRRKGWYEDEVYGWLAEREALRNEPGRGDA